MDKTFTVVFWTSLFLFAAFMLTIIVLGAIQITNLLGLSVWVWPALSLSIFTITVAWHGVKRLIE